MQAAKRPYVLAAAALAATGLVALTPIAQRVPGLHVANLATRLLSAGDSLLNVPVNLFYDLANVPSNEIQSLDYLGNSLIFSGPLFVTGSTNIFGIDPGDPGHFASLINIPLPFPALTGIDAPQYDFGPTGGLDQQFVGLLAAELPVTGFCDASQCVPTVPEAPITGFSGIDEPISGLLVVTGQDKFPLIDNFFQVPLSTLTSPSGYTFGPNYPGYVDPSGPAYSSLGFEGTKTLDGVQNVMPFGGETYHLDPLQPFNNFFASLMAPPATDGNVAGTGINLPDFTELGRALQTLTAGSVIFSDPLTPGSPTCSVSCADFITANHLDYPDAVKEIGNLWPGNTSIDTFLANLAAGTANVPTASQIAESVVLYNPSNYDFGNPSPPPSLTSPLAADLYGLAPMFHQLYTNLGLNPPPLSDAISMSDSPVPAAAEPSMVSAAFDPSALTAFDHSALTAFDPSALSSAFDPSALTAFDPSALSAAFDPSALSADLSTLWANLLGTL